MKLLTKKITVEMGADCSIKDITDEISKFIGETKLKEGLAIIFAPGSTGAISTMEYEPGLLKDIPRALEKIAPSNAEYEHHKTWHDDNGRSHVRSTIIGSSLVVPFIDGKLTLGTWQQVVVMNLDTRAREREVVIQVMGE
jgi:secondary thiamine-phosphate synthase enzyme